jgi:uncharacterized membrane-anchored protein YitT (DUF2179 family)
MLILARPPAEQHSLLEDVQGILVGATLVALSVQFLNAAGLFTGQIAGLAIIGTSLAGWSFGALFFVMNLPFYALAVVQLGWRFTIRSLVAVSLMSAMADAFSAILTIDALPPVLGAVLFGVLAGAGLLALFRHGATLGGVGIVALWLQDRNGFPAGRTQLIFDGFVFALALFLFDWNVVAWSLLGSVIVNQIVTVNHRRDRYVARS